MELVILVEEAMIIDSFGHNWHYDYYKGMEIEFPRPLSLEGLCKYHQYCKSELDIDFVRYWINGAV